MLNRLSPEVRCIAHRGAASLAPENTLAAARKAFELGAAMWELDVSVTADGELIVLHDDSLARTTNVVTVFPERAPWPLTAFTLAEIKRLDSGSWYLDADPFGTIASGAVPAAEQAAWRGEPIPTLREALLFTREHDWRVNVEIKASLPPLDSFPVVEAVVALIEALDMVERVILSSFVHSYLPQAKALNPALPTAALIDAGETWPEGLVVDAFHPHYTLATAEKVRALRQAGFAVHPWTVNDRLEMRRLIQAGVTGIITDFPQILKPLTDESIR